MARHRIPARLRQVLDDCGEPWEIVNGARHSHIRVAGRLVGTLPRHAGGQESLGDRQWKNLVAQVRRAVKTP